MDKGEDYDRVKLLEISAEDAERWERKKKKNPDPGFSGLKPCSLSLMLIVGQGPSWLRCYLCHFFVLIHHLTIKSVSYMVHT